MSLRLAWRPNRQEKNPWQLAAKYIDFPCHSILGGLCLAAGRQEHLPWRFTYIPWRISTAKVNLVSGSGIYPLADIEAGFYPLSRKKKLILPVSLAPQGTEVHVDHFLFI